MSIDVCRRRRCDKVPTHIYIVVVMGIITSLFSGGTGRTDDPDPITGLTSRDKYLIRSSWDVLKKDLTKNGVALLMLLFETYPDEIRHFQFKELPLKDLPANKKFQAHCNAVMYAVSSIVDSLDDSELLVQILTKLGENHKRRKITSTSFGHLKTVMLDLFKSVMSTDAVNSWDKALEVSFKVIGSEL